MKIIFASALLCCALVANAETANQVNPEVQKEVNPEAIPEVTPAVTAEAVSSPVNFVLQGGLTIGGDEIAFSSNGTSLDAGGLIYLGAGAVYHVTPKLDVQAMFGLHFDEITGTNGSVKFSRKFIEVMPYYVMDNGHRIGVGYTQILSPKISGLLQDEFENTNAVIFQYDWLLNKGFYLGFRYADITYDDKNSNASLDGSYFGVMMQAHFGN